MDRQAVYGILFSSDKKKVFLVQRRDLPVWVLPGGGLDQGESPAEGVVREVEEETGYKVVVKKQTAEYLPVNRLTQRTFVFICTITGGHFSPNQEARKGFFFPIDDLPSRLPPPFALWIKEALLDSPTVLVKKTEGVTYRALCRLLLLHPLLVTRYLLSKVGIRINARD